MASEPGRAAVSWTLCFQFRGRETRISSIPLSAGDRRVSGEHVLVGSPALLRECHPGAGADGVGGVIRGDRVGGVVPGRPGRGSSWGQGDKAHETRSFLAGAWRSPAGREGCTPLTPALLGATAATLRSRGFLPRPLKCGEWCPPDSDSFQPSQRMRAHLEEGPLQTEPRVRTSV